MNITINKISFMLSSLVILVGFVSCNIETETEIDDITIPSRLVMNGIINAGNDTSQIYYSDSKSIFGHENVRDVFWSETAWSYLYVDPTVYLLPNVETIFYKNGIVQSDVIINPDDSITYVVNRVRGGDHIRIEATQGSRKVSSEIVIPNDPLILNIDTLSFGNGNGSYGKPAGLMMRLLINIKDEPGIKNYYRLFTDRYIEVQLDPDYARRHDMPEVVTGFLSYFYTEDPAITKGYPEENNNSDIINYEKNYFNIFTDELFEGKEYLLNVYIPTPENPSGYYLNGYFHDSEYIVSRKEKLVVRLQAINEELFQYLSSLNKFVYRSHDLIEPLRIFNNINGGLGILGGCNEVKQTVYDITFEVK